MRSSKNVSIRRNLAKEDGRICRYCLKQFTIDELTIDHVIPRSWFALYKGQIKPQLIKSYVNNKNNLVLACKDCNGKKGNTLKPFYPPYRMYVSGILYDYFYLNLIKPKFKKIWLQPNGYSRWIRLYELFDRSRAMVKFSRIDCLTRDYPRHYIQHYNIDVALNVIAQKKLQMNYDQRFKRK